jgi:3-deoxy-D-manno-octulosonic-acid transferase
MIVKLYDFITLIGSLLVTPFFFFHQRGKVNLKERYGDWKLGGRRFVWCHGASAGEVRGLLPLLPTLRIRFPYAEILLTVTSPTGLSVAGDKFDETRLIPFDSSVWLKRALRDVHIDCLIISETELWPCVLQQMSQASVPIFLVNARISDLTNNRYQLLRSLFAKSLSKVTAVATADLISMERFEKLGVLRSRLKLTGNAKYDTPPKIKSTEESLNLRHRFWNDDKPVLVLGSIRPGEENWWFETIADRFTAGTDFRVVVAPRHKEKFDWFASRLRDFGLEFDKWSEMKESNGARSISQKVVLLDTFGDLEGTYSFATLAFIGATMVNIGGHNPLEASAYRVPVAMGIYTHVVQEVAQDLESVGALLRIKTKADVEKCIDMLFKEESNLRERGEAGYSVWKKHSGAAKRIAQLLEANGS